jgi:RHS repeat-associated protein
LYHHGIEQSEGAIFVYHAEGRAALYPPEEVNASSQSWRYEYSMDDHLGNVRLTFSDLNGDGYIQANPGDWSGDGNPGGVKEYSEVLQENHYYPFGMSMEGQWRMPDLVQKTNRYQFNGIERHGDMNVDLDLAVFRSYDAAMARWLHVDPLAEDFPSWSSYNFAVNSPLKFTDPSGLSPEDIIIKGKNNSSVRLKTDLIDITVNASSLNIDFGGNFTLEGEAVLSAGLDIVGIVDPTGVADALNAGLQWKNGEWTGAAISAASLIPFIGDVSKIGKIKKDVKIISDAIEEVKMYRVQGSNLPNASKVRIRDEGGKISIDGDDMLYVTFHDKNRAMEFMKKRGDGAQLFEASVKKEFYQRIRDEAVSQKVGKMFPGRPQQVDVTRTQNSYGIPKEYFNDLLNSIIK